jgi:hypothetical protein
MTTDKTMIIFNRWFKILVGIFLMGMAIYSKQWILIILGFIFAYHGISNTGCNGNCSIPQRRK